MARTTPSPVIRAPQTVIGTLDAARQAQVDAHGRVHLGRAAWALDWWIGAEDRWHVPADEASTRQRLVGAAPVVETRVRVPSGDAVQRVYGARDLSGASVVVVEIENDSKVPFAVALAVRPAAAAPAKAIRDISAEGTEVRVDGKLALLAARAPGRRVALASADGDVAEVVLGGKAQPEAAVEARDSARRAQAAVVFPLAHSATLRVVLPLEGGALDVAALPAASQVASGWRTHARRGARVELPDRRVQDALDSNICHLLLRPDGLAAAAALGRFGFAEEAAATLLGNPVATAATSAPGEALLALAAYWTLTRDEDFAQRAVPLVATLVESLGRKGTAAELHLGAIATSGAAGILAAAGQAQGAEDVRRAGVAMAAAAAGATPPPAPTGIEPILEMLSTASPTWTWVGPTEEHSLAVAAALLVAVRSLLVAETPGPEAALRLSPDVPASWYGQGWEVHDLPTAHGPLSYAVRWHGDRPAVLWELVPWPGAPPVTLTMPRLDPAWSSDQASGEALLAPVPIPAPVVAPVTTEVTLGRKPDGGPS